MTDFQTQKSIARAYLAALTDTAPDALTDAASQHSAPDALLRAVHPWGEIRGTDAHVARVWHPIRAAFSHLQRRPDIFLAGHSAHGPRPGDWAVSAGHLMGLFDAPFLNIRPTRRMAFLRYAHFLRIEGTQITEQAFFLDIPFLMLQAGLQPFPPQTGVHVLQPGPVTHDGLLYDHQPSHEGRLTLGAIEAMVNDLGEWGLGLPLEQELARTWHPDMIWWGPAGIGSTYTIPRYARQHSGVFRGAFTDRSKSAHECRLAEGHYGGFFGWPSFSARHKGGFQGMPGSDKRGEFRVVDLYRRQGDKLAENWVYIDMLHFWMTQGVDILARTTDLAEA